MNSRKTHDPVLDALFEAGRAETPPPSDAFMARLAADADAALPRAGTVTAPGRNAPTMLTRFKGFFAASGLSGAAALGVWIGFAMPDIVTMVAPLAQETDGLTMFLPGADLSVFSE